MSQKVEKVLNDFLYDEEDEFYSYEYLEESELDLKNANNSRYTIART
jgi:hypothetical protein